MDNKCLRCQPIDGPARAATHRVSAPGAPDMAYLVCAGCAAQAGAAGLIVEAA